MVDVDGHLRSPDSTHTDEIHEEHNPGRRSGRQLAALVPSLAAFITTIWVFRRSIFSAELPGDTADARWTIAVHEHWYQVWQGVEGIRDLHFYYPVPGMLGASDAFFVQGQIYSVVRMLAGDLITSWLVAQIGFFLIGSLGVAVLARRVLDNLWSQTAMVVMICASYPVLVSLDHVQLIGFLFASWFFVGIHDLATDQRPQQGLALVVAVPILLALSSWYAFVLLFVVLAFLGFYSVLLNEAGSVSSRLKQVLASVLRLLRSLIGIASAALFVLGWAVVMWVYLPARNMAPFPEVDQLIRFSPRISDILNAAAGGGGLWSAFYESTFEDVTSRLEQALGLTPILFLSVVVAGLLHLRSALLRRSAVRQRAGLLSCTGVIVVWFTIFTTLLVIVTDDRGLSVYRFFWLHVPGLESIRAPFRVMIYVYGLAVFLLLRSIEMAVSRVRDNQASARRRRAALVVAFAIPVLIITEMQRPPYAMWTRDDLLDPGYLAQIPAAQHLCDAFALYGQGSVNPIDAVIFSALSGIPTGQGYTRAAPKGHPGTYADSATLANWMRSEGFDGTLCEVSPRGTEPVTTT